MRHLSVQQLAVLGFTVAALAVFALAGSAWRFAEQTLAASAFVSHSHQVIGEINDLESSLYRAESGQRAFLATRQPVFLRERDTALDQVEQRMAQLLRLTSDNETQQRRLVDLRRELAQRVAVYRETERRIESNEAISVDGRLAEGSRVLAGIRPIFEALAAEERGLLRQREAIEQERARTTGRIFIVFVGLLVLLLPTLFWRIRRDLQARRAAELQVAEERHYDAMHARALTLYNAELSREGVLDGTLALLAETPLFPVSVFYAYEEIGGMLRTAASRAAPADLKPLLRLDDGPIGMAGRLGEPVYLDGFDAATGLRIETGLATLAPAAMLLCPVTYQGRLLGVLALAAAAALTERDRAFIVRLCAQLGVALHNLGQLQELSLLAEQLRVRGEDIQLKNAELEKASRMKSEFLANMSHELRTPLNAVIGFSEILKDGLAGPLADEQTEYITDIYTSGKHLLSLINDILDLSKVESGHAALELEALEPIHIATSSMSVMREKAASGRIRLVTLCPPGQGSLMADARKAKQIAYNLLANAFKFTPEGGTVTLGVERVDASALPSGPPAADTRVFLPPPHGSFLQISVEDSGIGIAPDDLQLLFEPFVQIDSSLSRRFQGTGLGLTMVKRLTELHGGGLMVSSTPGVGSVFTVWLPWRPLPPAAPPQPAVAEVPVPAPGVSAEDEAAPLVLVVEDDPQAAGVIRLQLQAQGYRVELSRSAEEGLPRAVSLRPAAIVLDIILPGMDGWDMLTRLKEQPETRHIPIVIVSITDEARRGFALGASQVLCKPVSQDDLVAALAAVGLDARNADAEVLVVDDDPKAVTLVSKHLQFAGFAPLAAYGGREALEMVRRRPPALIVLDLMMPDLSGLDVVQMLRDRPETADIPIIVLTAKLLTAADRAQLTGRVQQVMEKSEFQPAGLVAEVKRALAKRSRQAA